MTKIKQTFRLRGAFAAAISICLAINFAAPVMAEPPGTNYYATQFVFANLDAAEMSFHDYFGAYRWEKEEMLECLASAKDPAGNWGVVTEGWQLSVRSRKTEFFPGEPVELLTLLRNLTTETRTVPLSKLGANKGFQYELRQGTNISRWVDPETKSNSDRVRPMYEMMRVQSQTQLATVVQLNEVFDFSRVGEYELTVQRPVFLQDDHVKIRGKTNIMSGAVKIRIVEKLSSAEVKARQEFAEKLKNFRQRNSSESTSPATTNNSLPKTEDK